jgi:hypothetical protein
MASKKKAKKAPAKKRPAPKKTPAKKAKKRAPVKASRKKTTRINFGFTVATKREAEDVQKKANKYADGNISLLLRHAVHTCKTHAHKGE